MDDLTAQLEGLNINNDKLRMVELFTGTGAFSLAFESTGRFKTVFANDFSKSSKKIYDMNFDIPLTQGDICKIRTKKIPKMDILTGGFNCQPFSLNGKMLGFKDERTKGFWKIIKIMRKHQPRFVVLENVKHLKNHDEGRSFDVVKKALRGCGYYLRYRVLNTRKITDIPQNRERIYIICFKEKRDYKRFKFPRRINNCRPMEEFLEDNVSDSDYYSDSPVWNRLRENVTERGMFYRESHSRQITKMKNGMCQTLLTSHFAAPFIKDDKGIRKITPRECFNLQGFPRDYKLDGISKTQLYRLAGNAITMPVAHKIAEEIVKLL